MKSSLHLNELKRLVVRLLNFETVAHPEIIILTSPYSQAGLRAVTLLPFQVPQHWVAFYQQKADTPEILTIEPLFNVLKLTFEWVRFGGE